MICAQHPRCLMSTAVAVRAPTAEGIDPKNDRSEHLGIIGDPDGETSAAPMATFADPFFQQKDRQPRCNIEIGSRGW